MATFLPNVTDNLPEPYLFDPEFDRIDRMLYQRENMYKQGAQKVKSLYESAFNSPMLRDSNIQNRDAYLKTINEGLRKVSASDLSLIQNQQTANSLFEPILNDTNLIHDIRYTKQLQNGLSEAETYRRSTDPNTRKMYWDTGVRAMQYQAEEYKKADPNSALGMAAPKYTKNVDIMGMADKLFKESGISVKQDTVSGNYIWSKKNGDLAIPLTASFVETMFAQDPSIQDMFKTQAYVERKDFMKQNAAKFGGEDKAEYAYLNGIMSSIDAHNQAKVDVDTAEVKDLKTKMDSWNKTITTVGIIPGSADHKAYLKDQAALEMAQQTVDARKSMSINPSMVNANDVNDLRSAVDRAVMINHSSLLTTKLATYLAYKNAEVTMKADPVSMAYLHDKLTKNRELTMAAVRNQYAKDIIDYKKKNGIGLTAEEKKVLEEQRVNKFNQNSINNGFNLFGGNQFNPFSSNSPNLAPSTNLDTKDTIPDVNGDDNSDLDDDYLHFYNSPGF